MEAPGVGPRWIRLRDKLREMKEAAPAFAGLSTCGWGRPEQQWRPLDWDDGEPAAGCTPAGRTPPQS